REIIPRLTSAHNYNYKSLPVYKFLGDLQMQHIAQPNIWDWSFLKALKYLPRVVYKNIILKKAQWKISKDNINKLLQSTNDKTLFCSEVKKQFNLTDRVVISEADNDLLIDFNETAAHELFHQHCKKNDNIFIEEFLFTQENCILKDERNAAYTNEIIIPLYETASPTKDFIAQKDINHKNVQRKFSPNSEWLYFKIYCGPKTAEKILSNQINAFINNGLRKGLFQKFFFIRFKDDFSHIRIRFYNADVAKQPVLQHQFLNYLQPLINNNSINKISIDTYNRELERYNAVLIEDAETIFFNDSFAVITLLNLFADDEEMRLYSALSGIDFLLNDFGLDIQSKHKILKTVQQSFFKEFGGLPNLQKQLNAKYRQHQKQIFLYLDEKSNTDSAIINETREIFGKRSIQNRFISQSMQTKMRAENPESFYGLIPHLLHMFINRMFINNQRKHELVIYHFMEKYYNSQLSIAGKKPL
ncbi:MAG: thiopeptide-type bacteriocin biosynthesis protein, partial [Parafilimonas sp.]